MAWGMDLSGLPRLKSYADCSAWREARSKELGRRNTFWDSNRVPLDGSRKQHVFMELKGDNSFALMLYTTTPLVVYHQDGFVSVSTYNTPASRDFMNAVLPDGIRAILRNGRMHLEVDCADGVRYCEPRYNDLRLEPVAPGRWHIPYGRTRPRRIAQVDWRKFHGIKQRKNIRALLLWRQTAERLGLEPKLQRQTPTMQKVLEAIHDQSLWADTFGDFTLSEIPCMVAEAEGILRINRNASTAMPYGRPVTSELKGKLPWLVFADEIVSL